MGFERLAVAVKRDCPGGGYGVKIRHCNAERDWRSLFEGGGISSWVIAMSGRSGHRRREISRRYRLRASSERLIGVAAILPAVGHQYD